jgi:putative DNA primase/helicase
MPTTLETARGYVAAGFSVVPIRKDGSKAPASEVLPCFWNEAVGQHYATWKPFTERLATPGELTAWYGRGEPWGIGLISGAVSGCLEQLDFDREATDIFPAWCALVEEERPGLIARLSIVRTPRQPAGYHVRYRCPDEDIPGNTKLAIDPGAPGDDRVLIETRGEGGYCVVPGSPPECHSERREYAHASGPELPPVIGPDERECLLRCARAFSRDVKEFPQQRGLDLRPGEDYERRGPDWAEILEPAGWKMVGSHGGERRWRRPGKDGPGWSATTGHCHGQDGADLLRVFSSNAAPLEDGRAYGKFRAFAVLNFQGDLSAAAEELARQGFGSAGPRTAPPRSNGHAHKSPVDQLLRQRLAAVEMIEHDALLAVNLPPPRWIVETLLADEGLTMLGGKKKTGKSFLCLQLAQAVAAGLPCLGRAVLSGPVIYICLEDGRRRLKDRLEKQAAGRGLPITYFTRFPSLDGDGMAELCRLLEARRPRLLIIDTLAAAKTGKTIENDAGPMADLTNCLRILAQHFSLGILVTHHHGKAIGGDPGDDLRGSSAIAGAADVNLGLYRDEAGFDLKGEGRDIEQFSLRLSFDRQTTWAWQLVGDSRRVDEEEIDKDICAVIGMLGETSLDVIQSELKKRRSTIQKRLVALVNIGKLIAQIRPTGHGFARTVYRLAATC